MTRGESGQGERRGVSVHSAEFVAVAECVRVSNDFTEV